jgi:hypothetical protein
MAGITPTAICNLALREIGAERIADYAADQSKEGRVARDIYQPTRRWVLAQCGWNGAKKAAQLTQMEDTTPTFWAYAYEAPTDLVRVLGIYGSNELGDTIPYELQFQTGSGDDESNVYAVLTASNQAYIRYVFDQQDLGALSEGFHQALTFRLARAFATALPRTEALKKLTDEEWRKVLTTSKAIDGQEDYPEQMAEGSWMGTRFGRYGGRSTFTGG